MIILLLFKEFGWISGVFYPPVISLYTSKREKLPIASAAAI
jgi:hypothetical protein